MKRSTVGQRIEALRLDRGWTHFDLSMRSGVREQNIRLWEKGRSPSIDGLAAIARAFGVSIDQLVHGDPVATEAV